MASSTTSAQTIEKTTDNTETKQHFISDEKYQLLKRYQQMIFDQTEVSFALRKLVNALITAENLDKLKAKYLQSLYSQS